MSARAKFFFLLLLQCRKIAKAKKRGFLTWMTVKKLWVAYTKWQHHSIILKSLQFCLQVAENYSISSFWIGTKFIDLKCIFICLLLRFFVTAALFLYNLFLNLAKCESYFYEIALIFAAKTWKSCCCKAAKIYIKSKAEKTTLVVFRDKHFTLKHTKTQQRSYDVNSCHKFHSFFFVQIYEKSHFCRKQLIMMSISATYTSYSLKLKPTII